MAATATGVYRTTYRGDMALRHTRAEYARLALMAAAVVAAPFYLEPYWLQVVNVAGIAIIAAVGLNIVTGYTGLISLATGGFLAVGAYVSANLISRAGLPTPVGWVAAVVVSALVGAFFGLPARRLKGIYLAIATLAAQYIIVYVVRSWKAATGGVGTLNVNHPGIGGYQLTSDFAWYWIIIPLAILTVAAAINLFRTGLGRALIAIRDQDIAAEVIGVHVARYKVLAFAVSAGMAGLAGALIASYRNIVTWERFTIDVSIIYVAFIIVGGLGSVSGAVYGTLFLSWLRAYIDKVGPEFQGSSLAFIAKDLPAIQLAIFGVVIVAILLIEPRGLARLWQRSKDYFRLWPFRY
jgi:branched-chain amino acid transport system permease protein